MTERTTDAERLTWLTSYYASVKPVAGWKEESEGRFLLRQITRLEQERDTALREADGRMSAYLVASKQLAESQREAEAWKGVAETHKENWQKVQAALAKTLREAGVLRTDNQHLRAQAGLPPIKTPAEQAMHETIQGQSLSMRAMGNELRQKDETSEVLRAVLQRVHDSLRTFVRESSDPGPEAMSAIWEAAEVLARSATKETRPTPAEDEHEDEGPTPALLAGAELLRSICPAPAAAMQRDVNDRFMAERLGPRPVEATGEDVEWARQITGESLSIMDTKTIADMFAAARAHGRIEQAKLDEAVVEAARRMVTLGCWPTKAFKLMRAALTARDAALKAKEPT